MTDAVLLFRCTIDLILTLRSNRQLQLYNFRPNYRQQYARRLAWNSIRFWSAQTSSLQCQNLTEKVSILHKCDWTENQLTPLRIRPSWFCQQSPHRLVSNGPPPWRRRWGQNFSTFSTRTWWPRFWCRNCLSPRSESLPAASMYLRDATPFIYPNAKRDPFRRHLPRFCNRFWQSATCRAPPSLSTYTNALRSDLRSISLNVLE